MRRSAAPAWLALCLAACSAGQTEPPTRGGECQQYLHALCARAIDDCHLSQWGSNVDQCVTDGETTCCGDTCDQAATSSEDSVAACQRAIAAATCELFATPAIPAECQHVVQ